MTHVQADVRRCRRELSSLYTTDVAALLSNNRYISNIVCAWNKCVLYNLHTCGYITVNTQVQGRFFQVSTIARCMYSKTHYNEFSIKRKYLFNNSTFDCVHTIVFGVAIHAASDVDVPRIDWCIRVLPNIV